MYRNLKKTRSKLIRLVTGTIRSFSDKPINLPKDPVFILGCGHSGTTLVLGLIGRHPAFYFVPFETYIFRPHRSFKEIRGFFLETAVKAQDRRIVEKTPRHVSDIKRILRIFPNARIIAMIRDGRDVSVSMRKRGLNLHQSIGRWKRACAEIEEFKDDCRVMPVRYEDLVSRQAITLNAIFAFFGEKQLANQVLASEKRIEWTFSKTRDIEEESKDVAIKRQRHLDKRKNQINRPIYNDIKKWEETLGNDEITSLHDAAGPTLKKWGYL